MRRKVLSLHVTDSRRRSPQVTLADLAEDIGEIGYPQPARDEI
ncbi:hypothetical protein ABT301_36730 [Streptomyces sp. NPDC000987]